MARAHHIRQDGRDCELVGQIILGDGVSAAAADHQRVKAGDFGQGWCFLQQIERDDLLQFETGALGERLAFFVTGQVVYVAGLQEENLQLMSVHSLTL